MNIAAALSVAQTLISSLRCSEFKEMCRERGYESELEELSHTFNKVRAVLLDAEAMQQCCLSLKLPREVQASLAKLKDVVYDADDLLDEYLTKPAQELPMEEGSHFWSPFEKLKEKLDDAISGDHVKFSLGLVDDPIRRRRVEASSYVNGDIIGREADVEKVVGMLLDSDVQEDVSFVSIVGVGGSGKTALADLVYNDERVVSKFPLRLWTCLSDQDQIRLDVKAIICKILKSATHLNPDDSSLELPECLDLQQLSQKRFLLVLDDLWTECREDWLKLVASLVGGQKESRVLVTTRSTKTAGMVGKFKYELKGLSNDNSWRLFVKIALPEVNEQTKPSVDVEKVIGMLLNPNVKRDVSSLTIVGVEGIGKTELARQVHDDERVKNAFPLRLWVCDGDQNPNHINIKAILSKILASTTIVMHENSTLEIMQLTLREHLVNGKFLIVLDNVWNENRHDWLTLEGFLKGGQKGSWVLVTTRSEETSKIVGNGLSYRLKGQSKDHSWRPQDLIEIGKRIVPTCAGVPLAMREVGSFLYGREEFIWKMVLEERLANDEFDVVLRSSYASLAPAIKSCFSYCAIFLRDHEISKQMVIEHWVAQGYVVPLEKGQSVEAVAEDYFTILLGRGFFQLVKKDKEDNVISFKLNDEMHDMARKVSEDEICMVYDTIDDVNEGVRHVFFGGHERYMFSCQQKRLHCRSYLRRDSVKSSSTKTRIRTFIQPRKSYNSVIDEQLVHKLAENFPCLRTLDLSGSNFESLPDSVGQLLHLRNLDLSYNTCLRELPNSITELYNLIFLGIKGCDKLTCLPSGMSKLCRLWRLERFMIGKANSSEKQLFDGLEDLKALSNLKGCLQIEITIPAQACTSVEEEESRRNELSDCLRGKEHLDDICIKIKGQSRSEFVDKLLEKLRPHLNIRILRLYGMRMPGWAIKGNLAISLPNLVRLEIRNSRGVRRIPWLWKLCHLRELFISGLPNLEWVEDYDPETSDSVAVSSREECSYFPILEEVELKGLPKFKGWWSTSPLFRCLPHVKTLRIEKCPAVTHIPFCPRLELMKIEGKFSLQVVEKDNKKAEVSVSKLLRLTTSELGLIKQIPGEYFQSLEALTIEKDQELENFVEVKNWFQSTSLSSLRTVDIVSCWKLGSVKGWIEHLPAVEILRIKDCHKLVGIPWQHLPPTLHSVEMDGSGDMFVLPPGLQYCTSLQSLQLGNCPLLQSLPTWMPKLTSLTKLVLLRCSKQFKERCKNPSGEYWPLIQHIPNVDISERKSA